MHEPGEAKVQVAVVSGGWWRLPGAAVVNGTRAAGGGGEGIVLPVTGAAGGAVDPVDVAGA